MRPPPLPISWSGHDPAVQTAEQVIRVSAERSIALVLPGLWGADEVTAELDQRIPMLRIDSRAGDNQQACPLALAMRDFEQLGPEPSDAEVAEAMHRWAAQAGAEQAGAGQSGLPLIVVEGCEQLHRSSAETLIELTRMDLVRLVLMVGTESGLGEHLKPLQSASALVTLSPESLSATGMKAPLAARLPGIVSPAVARRVAALSGGHPMLAHAVVEAAQSADVLKSSEGTWLWSSCEAALRRRLAAQLPGLLAGLDETEQELLVLTAVAGYLPERWAGQHFGEETVLSLRRQRILATDHLTRHGFLNLYLLPTALTEALRQNLSPTEITRLWYMVGQHIPDSSGGRPTEAALTWWAARAGEQIPSAVAERASDRCLAGSWYTPVAEIAAAADEPTPGLRVLLARTHFAVGDISAAVAELQRLAAELASDPGVEAEGAEAQRHGLIIARRIEIFHPEEAAAVIEQLQGLGSAGRPKFLEQAMALTVADDADTWMRTLVKIRHSADWEEVVAVQLWIGTQLGLGRHPALGRLTLSILLDDLIREGGQPDVEDAATAVLLLISLTHDWRTDMDSVELRTWGREPADNLVLAGVADLVTSVVAMQQDRMLTAATYAVAALRTFERRDTYGLVQIASALSATAASFVSFERGIEAHRLHREAMGEQLGARGLPSIRLLTRGFSLIGTGPPSEQIAAGLTELAVQAREEDEWMQEQQLLLVAMPGGSPEAVQQALTAPWADLPGRTRMVALTARSLAESDDRAALESAKALQAAGATFFAVTILAARWHRRAQMRPEDRAEAINLVLTMRRQATERSEMLEVFDEVSLDGRERAVVAGLGKGHSTAAIAKSLSLSPRTVEASISALLHRFGCENRVELVSLDLLVPE